MTVSSLYLMLICLREARSSSNSVSLLTFSLRLIFFNIFLFAKDSNFSSGLRHVAERQVPNLMLMAFLYNVGLHKEMFDKSSSLPYLKRFGVWFYDYPMYT